MTQIQCQPKTDHLPRYDYIIVNDGYRWDIFEVEFYAPGCWKNNRHMGFHFSHYQAVRAIQEMRKEKTCSIFPA